MNGERAVDVVYLSFSKAFNAASHNILVDKLSEDRPGNWNSEMN